MSYTATSPVGIALQKLRRMIALSATFQSLAGGSYAEALERVYYRDHEEDYSDNQRCLAVLDEVQSGWELVGGGTQQQFRPRMVLWCFLGHWTPDPSQYGLNESRLRAIDWAENVMKEVAEIAGQDDDESTSSHLCFTAMDLQEADETPLQQQAKNTSQNALEVWHSWSLSVGDGG